MADREFTFIHSLRERITSFRILYSLAKFLTFRGQALEDAPSILVVEDEMPILNMMESTLGDGGFKVISASSGERAIQMLDAQNPPFQAVITDVNLGPRKSGWEVAKHAREIDPEISIMYVTGHGADDWASQGLPKSIMLTKPFAIAQLLTAVSNLLNGSPQQD
jgi:DNA-binding response OmpR family regulator